MPPDDAALAAMVAAARGGDDHAWAALVQRFTPLLRRVAQSYRLPPYDVDDVVQECWVAALGHLHSLREPAAVGAWLVTTVRRNALRAHQRVVRELVSDAPLPEAHPAPECLEDTVVAAERVDVVRDAVRRLPERQRAILESLMTEPGSGYAEISERLGIPVGSIGPTRERGLQRLRRDARLTQVVAS
jgi:RNA polymerase sigma factor (sigma-70 family)